MSNKYFDIALTRKLEGREKRLPLFPDCDVAQLRCEHLYVRDGSEFPSVFWQTHKLDESVSNIREHIHNEQSP